MKILLTVIVCFAFSCGTKTTKSRQAPKPQDNKNSEERETAEPAKKEPKPSDKAKETKGSARNCKTKVISCDPYDASNPKFFSGFYLDYHRCDRVVGRVSFTEKSVFGSPRNMSIGMKGDGSDFTVSFHKPLEGHSEGSIVDSEYRGTGITMKIEKVSFNDFRFRIRMYKDGDEINNSNWFECHR